jgi:transmembrane sensor
VAEAHHLPDMDQIEREASEWVARLNADDVSDEDRARFAAWCQAHVLNARAYEALSATWRGFTATGPLVRAVAFGESMTEAAEIRTPRLRWLRVLLERFRPGQ